jgi:hypothetical protein
MQRRSEVQRVASGSTIETVAGAQGEMVVAKVPQGYETRINVRLVPVRDVEIAATPNRCQPREGAPRRDAEPLDLPRDLVEKLKKADRAVVAWLAEDEANARLFMVQPAEALVKAGVELSRDDQKAISRTHREVSEAAVVGPGVKVASLTAVAFPRGQIGKIKPGAKPASEQDDDPGCAKEV